MALAAVSVLILVGDVRPGRFQWTGEQLFPSTHSIPTDCDVFVVADPADAVRPPWVYELDAMALARREGLRTANGCSGISPFGYPTSTSEAPGLLEARERIRWALAAGSATAPCIVEYMSAPVSG